MDVLDRSVLSGLRALPGEGAGSLLDEVVDIFMLRLPERLAAIAAAVQAKDAAAAERAAHSLKGAAAAVGARELAAACQALESAAESGRAWAALTTTVESAASRAGAALQEEKGR